MSRTRQQALDVLDRAIAERSWAGALVTTAHRRSTAAFLGGVAILYSDSSDGLKNTRDQRTYQDLLLSETWVDVVDGSRFRESLVDHDRMRGATRKQAFITRKLRGYGRELVPAGALTCELILDNHTARVDQSGPVVSFDAPPFSSEEAAIRSWLFRGHEDHFGFHGRWMIVVPDDAASVKGVVLKDERLWIAMSNVERGASDRVVQVVSRLHGRADGPSKSFSPESTIECDVHPDSQVFDVYVVKSPTTLISHHMFHRSEIEYVDKVQADTVRDLLNGENEEVEYKPWIDPGAKPRGYGKRSFLKTVVAFANTHGGRLYIGVNDEGEPVGQQAFKKVVAPHAKKTDPHEWYLRWAKKRMLEDIAPPPPGTLAWVEHHGEPVLRVDVAPGGRRPYACNRIVYLRVGATSRIADPHTELPGLTPRRSGGR